MKLILAEDDSAFAEWLILHLAQEGFEVCHSPSGADALLRAKQGADLVLLDWTLQDLWGLEVCRQLRQTPETRAVPIIMLTADSEELDLLRGFEAGADDFITKPFEPRELVARIQAVIRRVRPRAELLAVGDIELDLAAYKVRRRGKRVELASTEFRLLRYMLENPACVLSRERLLRDVWPHDPHIDARTVNTHIGRLRRALRAGGSPDPIRTVRSAGYSLEVDP